MANISLNCTNCGAPVEYDGSDIPAIKCPFCATTLVIPPEMRPGGRPASPGLSVSARRSLTRLVVAIVVFTVLCIGVTTVLPLILGGVLAGGALSMTTSQIESISTRIVAAVTEAPAVPTEVPAPTRAPTPTPGYLLPGISFGQNGINPGQFTNACCIATDGGGTLYVADHSGGRVQAFDLTGKYLYQWKVGTAKTTIQGLAADRSGSVYLAYAGDIYKVDAKTGEQTAKFSSGQGGEFGELLMTPEGSLAAVWYEGRWGFITSLEGHREAVYFFSPAGKVLKTYSAPISTQTDEPALDIYIAIDGRGSLYALNDGMIYAFGPEGKYINQFEVAATSPSSIRTDSQGQLVVGDSQAVHVLSPKGQPVGSFAIQGTANGLAYDDNGSLWVLASNQVTQFIRNGK